MKKHEYYAAKERGDKTRYNSAIQSVIYGSAKINTVTQSGVLSSLWIWWNSGD